jgi:hypothetical protein
VGEEHSSWGLGGGGGGELTIRQTLVMFNFGVLSLLITKIVFASKEIHIFLNPVNHINSVLSKP